MERFQAVFRIEKTVTVTAYPKGSAIIKDESLHISGKKREIL